MSQEAQIGSISKHFAKVRDPRIERTKRHRLMDILVIAICGANSWVDIELFGKSKIEMVGEDLVGCEVDALDCTPNERPEAETLEDRGSLKTQKGDPVRYGHKYSWLVRLIHWGTSWVARVDIQRVDTSLSDSQVGSVQVQELDLRNPKQKVIVADSLYGNYIFLTVFGWSSTPLP